MDVVQGLEGVSNLGGGLGGRDNSPEEVSFLPQMRGIRRREQVKWFQGDR